MPALGIYLSHKVKAKGFSSECTFILLQLDNTLSLVLHCCSMVVSGLGKTDGKEIANYFESCRTMQILYTFTIFEQNW